MQGFLSRTEGALFKWVRKGSPATAPWHICKQEGAKLRQVCRRTVFDPSIPPIFATRAAVAPWHACWVCADLDPRPGL